MCFYKTCHAASCSIKTYIIHFKFAKCAVLLQQGYFLYIYSTCIPLPNTAPRRWVFEPKQVNGLYLPFIDGDGEVM